MEELTLAQRLIVWAPPVLFAITLHEAAHGWMARRFGDPTAEMLGRVSLNPLRHVDPVGTVLVPALLLLVGGFLFGWAKPVPVNAGRFANPRRDMAVVAVAGPVANLLMVLLWAAVLRLGLGLGDVLPWATQPLVLMAVAGIYINVVLMVLNLVPLPPLDGGRVAVGVLPFGLARALARCEPWGLLVIIGLLALGLLQGLLAPFIQGFLTGGAMLAGVDPRALIQVLYSLL